MRTTVSIDDALLAQAKEVAARNGRSLSALIEDALRQSLARRDPSARSPVQLPTFAGRLQPGVDLDDSAALVELMDAVMQLPDVNVLVYAYATDAPGHGDYRRWLEGLLAGDEAFAVSELVLSGFVRVVTHPRVFSPPSPVDDALAFADQVRSQPHAALISPGARHWTIFSGLCRSVEAKGNLVPDAYLAALAIETGSEWITTDGDFGRFPGLRWRHPLRDVGRR